METDWAANNLQVIRTLMERGAVYRRALSPVMGGVGLIGLLAAVLAAILRLRAPQAIIAFWMAVALLGVGAAFFLIRRQALKDSEAFWSPPTRRIVQAVSPAFFAGLSAGLIFLSLNPQNQLAVWLLVPFWMVLYGCALHAAGFFMPRGFKLFGWAFILAGCLLAGALCLVGTPSLPAVNWMMGALFGASHLAYGVYLHFTEKDGNAT